MSALRPTRRAEAYRRRTCTNCNRTGHLASGCKRPEGAIDKLGIEIEGYWTELSHARQTAIDAGHGRGCSDGSLPNDARCYGCGDDGDGDCDCTGGSVPRPWEFQTAPGTLGEQIRALQLLYPNHTSTSCGLHVHASFRQPGYVALLTTDEFFWYWRMRWEAWGAAKQVTGTFWRRLRNGGEDEGRKYCERISTSDFTGHAITSQRSRYKQINFLAWGEHYTVEFRLLPMFQQQAFSISAIEELVDIVETWIAAHASELVPSVDVHFTPMSESWSQAVDMELELPAPSGCSHDLVDAVGLPDITPSPGGSVIDRQRAMDYVNDQIRNQLYPAL